MLDLVRSSLRAAEAQILAGKITYSLDAAEIREAGRGGPAGGGAAEKCP